MNKLDYQERLEMLDLPTLTYRRFRGSIIETYKILHNLYDINCTNSLLNLKNQIHVDISLQLKQNYQEPALDEIVLVYE